MIVLLDSKQESCLLSKSEGEKNQSLLDLVSVLNDSFHQLSAIQLLETKMNDCHNCETLPALNHSIWGL